MNEYLGDTNSEKTIDQSDQMLSLEKIFGSNKVMKKTNETSFKFTIIDRTENVSLPELRLGSDYEAT